jgi:hypothetical protein
MFDLLEQFKELNRPTVEKKSWMEDVDFRLATVADLDTIVEECIAAKIFGLDLETTGLDSRTYKTDSGKKETYDKITGYCLAPSSKKGWYLPVRHKGEGAKCNIPPRLVTEAIQKIVLSGSKAVFHNAKFDQKFLKFEPSGEIADWDDHNLWEDTIILAYLRDPREKQKGLKYLAKTELNREMIELEELFTPEAKKSKRLDFSTLDPAWDPVVWYAAADAVNTLSLYDILSPTVIEKDSHGKSQKSVYKLEKACLASTMWMEDCEIYIDREKLVELIKVGQVEWWDSIKDVYADASLILGRDVRPRWVYEMERIYNPQVVDPTFSEIREKCMLISPESPPTGIKKVVAKIGSPKIKEEVSFPDTYDVTNPPKLGTMMREMGIEGLVATEGTGQVKTDQETLDQIIEEAGEKYPFMKKVKRLREVAKGLTSYLFSLYWDSTPERAPQGRVKASFDGFKVDTGRFATPTPKEKRKEFFNGQVRWMVHGTPASHDKSKPDCVRRIREVVASRPGWYVFAIDYSGVELRIVSNLSGEKKWIDEFFHCSSCDKNFPRDQRPPPFCPECGSDKIGDLHTLTALSVFGEGIKGTPEFKQRRNESKGVNFGMCYGGGPAAVQRAVGTDYEESCRIKNKFDSTYRTLQKWWKVQHGTAKKQKYVTTSFGRRYPVPDIDHEYGSFRAKAERNAVNGPVQGTSSDIIKLAMALIYKEMKKRGWLDTVLMTITIHDELVFEIHESVVGEAVQIIERIMTEETTKNLDWLVPLKVDVEFGSKWTTPYNLTEMTWNKSDKKWTPVFAKVFPWHYNHYLSCGGVPVEGVEAESHTAPSDGTQVPPPYQPPAAKLARDTLLKNFDKATNTYTYVVRDEYMTSGNAEKLAAVVMRCRDMGVDKVKLTDSSGESLLEDEYYTSFSQFLTIAEYEGFSEIS